MFLQPTLFRHTAADSVVDFTSSCSETVFPISNRVMVGNTEVPVITLLGALFKDLRDTGKIQDYKINLC